MKRDSTENRMEPAEIKVVCEGCGEYYWELDIVFVFGMQRMMPLLCIRCDPLASISSHVVLVDRK